MRQSHSTTDILTVISEHIYSTLEKADETTLVAPEGFARYLKRASEQNWSNFVITTIRMRKKILNYFLYFEKKVYFSWWYSTWADLPYVVQEANMLNISVKVQNSTWVKNKNTEKSLWCIYLSGSENIIFQKSCKLIQ